MVAIHAILTTRTITTHITTIDQNTPFITKWATSLMMKSAIVMTNGQMMEVRSCDLTFEMFAVFSTEYWWNTLWASWGSPLISAWSGKFEITTICSRLVSASWVHTKVKVTENTRNRRKIHWHDRLGKWKKEI